MSFKDKIYSEIAAGRNGTTREALAKRLKVRAKSANTSFGRLLAELLAEGKVIMSGNRLYPGKSPEIKGVLHGNSKGYAFLIREEGEDIFIPHKGLAGAQHGDTVRIRMTGENEGEVIAIEKRGTDQIVGTYIKLSQGGIIVADNKDFFTDIYVADEDAHGAENNTKVVAGLIYGQRPNGGINGKIVEVLGKSGARDAEVLSILRSYRFSEKFPDNVLEAAKGIVYQPDFEGREDLRELYTITIDGEDAKDFDDAISVQKTQDSYLLYVHIADVSHYVPKGGAIDKEAFLRGTSVYFPGSVYPMLPESLSNGVCSLRPDEEKLTLTVLTEIAPSGKVIRRDFMKSVIRSNRRMTYTEVSGILSGEIDNASYADVKEMLFAAQELAEILKAKRKNAGAVNFISDECRILVNEKGDVLDLAPYPVLESNTIIEMFMVLANETVAEYLETRGIPAVYRIHEQPSEEKFKDFMAFINALGYTLNIGKGITPKLLSNFLEKIKGDPAEKIINKALLRSMQKARYSTTDSGHFGLSLKAYCHFTSPIRRYPDLMVHRALKAVLERQDTPAFRNSFLAQCEETAYRSSEREVASERAERDIDDYYKAVYMSGKIGEHYRGIVSGVLETGIFVVLPNTAEGFVSLDSLPRDRYAIDVRKRLAGTKYVFATGDEIEITVRNTDIASRRIFFEFSGQAAEYLKKPRMQSAAFCSARK
jgi:ribonuclease R